jgi:membrane protease YdiL (CAAX protease family)
LHIDFSVVRRNSLQSLFLQTNSRLELGRIQNLAFDRHFVFLLRGRDNFDQYFRSKENDFQQMLQSSRAAVYLVAFFATFTAPLVEEVVYRGVLYSAFQRRLGQDFRRVLVTVLFAAVHVPQYSKNFDPDYGTIFTLLIVSLILTLIRVRAKSLLPCIVLHTIFNGAQSVLLILEPI